jgi:hypothetical protein
MLLKMPRLASESQYPEYLKPGSNFRQTVLSIVTKSDGIIIETGVSIRKYSQEPTAEALKYALLIESEVTKDSWSAVLTHDFADYNSLTVGLYLYDVILAVRAPAQTREEPKPCPLQLLGTLIDFPFSQTNIAILSNTKIELPKNHYNARCCHLFELTRAFSRFCEEYGRPISILKP